MFCLQVNNLTKIFGKRHNPFKAVDDISFSLKSGEIVGLLGPNGSGKTTTIQMLLGILTPTSGKILYFEKDFNKHRSEILNSVSFASTYVSLPYVLTIEENLKVFARLYKVKDIFKVCDPLLERFGILHKKKSLVSSLSAGQLTRFVLVKAFSTRPKIVLLDEPTASLDPDISADICEFLKEQRDLNGISLLFTSHKMNEVSDICDRVIFLQKGKIIADDLPKNLAQKISQHKIKLVIVDKIEMAIKIAKQKKASYDHNDRVLELSLHEDEIPAFLKELMQEDVVYSNIYIKEPSLEEYFKKIAKKQ